MTCSASEQLIVEDALKILPVSAEWVRAILARITPFSPLPEGVRVLDIGACQGRGVVELVR